jgi:hypothetical protein
MGSGILRFLAVACVPVLLASCDAGQLVTLDVDDASLSAGGSSPAPPAAADTLNATPAGSTAAEVTWGDDSSNEDGFRVERSMDGGASWSLAGSIDPDGTAFYDRDRASEQQLCYRVIAFNAEGDSRPSNVDCTTLPAAPSDAVVTVDADGGGLFTWKDNSNVEDGYQVWYCGPEECAPLADLPPNSERWRDPWYYSGFQYYIVALKDGGYSDGVMPGPANGGAQSATLPNPSAMRTALAGRVLRESPLRGTRRPSPHPEASWRRP